MWKCSHRPPPRAARPLTRACATAKARAKAGGYHTRCAVTSCGSVSPLHARGGILAPSQSALLVPSQSALFECQAGSHCDSFDGAPFDGAQAQQQVHLNSRVSAAVSQNRPRRPKRARESPMGFSGAWALRGSSTRGARAPSEESW